VLTVELNILSFLFLFLLFLSFVPRCSQLLFVQALLAIASDQVKVVNFNMLDHELPIVLRYIVGSSNRHSARFLAFYHSLGFQGTSSAHL
jgi:hypothetical protein